MKKIIIVTDFFYPHWTGISKSIHYLTQALASRLEFVVLTVKYDQTLSAKETVNNVCIIRKKYLFGLSRTKYSFSLLTTLISIVKQQDVVLINSPCSNIFFVSIIAKIFRKKLIIYHHGDLILPKSFLNLILEKVFDAMSLVGFLLADGLVTHTKDYAQHSRLLSKFQYKTKAIIPPLPYFDLKKTTSFKDKQLQIKLNKISKKADLVIGFAGRFAHEKGFDVLLQAAQIIIKNGLNLQLVFAGETQLGYENTFEKSSQQILAVKNNLHFLGLLNEDQLIQFYQNIDIFVLSSRSECFGLVQAEAMAQKTPVIAPDIPGARDLVKKTKFGLLFESENPHDLAKKILELNLDLAKTQSSYKNVKSYFDNTANANKFYRFITG